MEPAYQYRATMTRVIDGDTCVCQVDLGFEVFVSLKIRIRGVDTPERGEDGWLEAGQFLRQFLDVPLILVSVKDKRSFERWVVDLYREDNGDSIALTIIAKGYGRSMKGLPE
jgi:micrococcal nuclease